MCLHPYIIFLFFLCFPPLFVGLFCSILVCLFICLTSKEGEKEGLESWMGGEDLGDGGWEILIRIHCM